MELDTSVSLTHHSKLSDGRPFLAMATPCGRLAKAARLTTALPGAGLATVLCIADCTPDAQTVLQTDIVVDH